MSLYLLPPKGYKSTFKEYWEQRKFLRCIRPGTYLCIEMPPPQPSWWLRLIVALLNLLLLPLLPFWLLWHLCNDFLVQPAVEAARRRNEYRRWESLPHRRKMKELLTDL